jgi:dienelactone hydrolase
MTLRLHPAAGAVTALLAFATTALADDSQPGPFAVSQRTVTVTRTNGSTFTAQIRYPATGAAANSPFFPGAAPAPAVSFGHGFLSAVDLYDSTMDHLASHGYIVIATTSEGSLLPSHSNFALDIRQCLTWLEQQDVLASSWLFGAVDEARFGVSGHSMGGGASALAAAADARIKCLATLAAAETNPSAASAALSIQVPARYIVGSQDTIVAPATTQNQYGNTDAPRQFSTITGGSHCGFIDSAIIACDSGALARAEQLAKTRALLLGFFNTHLRGDAVRFATVWGAGAAVAGTTLLRDPRATSTLDPSSVSGGLDMIIPVQLTVTNTGPDASAFRPRALGGGLEITFEPTETAVLSAGQSASITVWVRGLAAGAAQSTVDVVRVRDGAGTSHLLQGQFAANPVPGDLDGDGDVDAVDLANLLSSWGACKGCPADFDGNGQVDGGDIAVLLSAWG